MARRAQHQTSTWCFFPFSSGAWSLRPGCQLEPCPLRLLQGFVQGCCPASGPASTPVSQPPAASLRRPPDCKRGRQGSGWRRWKLFLKGFGEKNIRGVACGASLFAGHPPGLPPPVATSGRRGFGCAARGLAAAPSSMGERQVRASLLSLPSHKPVLTPRCCFLAGSSPVSHRLPLLSPCVQVLDQNVAPQHLRGRWRGQCRSCLGRQGGGVVISGLKSQALVTSTAVETLRLWHLVPGLG